MDVLLFGPPGAGKGTQARLLSKRLSIPHISTGDMMRTERESGSDLGNKFSEYMSEGRLVPDELVGDLLAKRLRNADAVGGVVFDGYPRTLEQSRKLDEVLTAVSRSVSKVVLLEVGLDEILDRVLGRRVCMSCGQVYHLRYNPPPASGKCTECGGDKIEARKDDDAELTKRRYSDYLEMTAPLVEVYRQRQLLEGVSGVGSQEEVSQRIYSALGLSA